MYFLYDSIYWYKLLELSQIALFNFEIDFGVRNELMAYNA